MQTHVDPTSWPSVINFMHWEFVSSPLEKSAIGNSINLRLHFGAKESKLSYFRRDSGFMLLNTDELTW